MSARAPYTDAEADADDLRRLVETAPHEFFAHFNFNRRGLKPYFACDRVWKDGDGSVEATVALDALDGDEATVKLYTPDGDFGLALPDDGVTPAGTEIQFDEAREFRLRVEVNDELGERKANFLLRPRWMGLESKTGKNIHVPRDLANDATDAVNVSVRGSNIEFDRYGPLLREAAEAVGVSGHYFDDVHPTSNIQDAERYVRVHRDHAGPIHARDGPIAALGHLLEADRSGYRKLVQDDTETAGYYHTATLGPDRIAEAWPNHRLPKEVKLYHVRDNPGGRDEDDPLAHPKLGVSYQVNLTDRTLHLDADGLDRLSRELDETLYSVLADAGLDLRAGGETFVDDTYFDAANATTDAAVVDLDLTEIRHEQEAVVYQQFGDGLSPAEQDTLRTLVTDGGQVSPDDIAETTGRHPDTVYDALGRLHDLVDHTYGEVELRSTYLAELVTDALDAAERATERATNAAAEAVRASNRGLDDTTSAFIAWCEAHGINYGPEDTDLDFDLGDVTSIDEVRRILREGLELWTAMGRDERAYRTATVHATIPKDGPDTTYLDTHDPTAVYQQDVWEFLRLD